MKKLLGLVAIALMLSFAAVSVGWASPAQNHDQQKQQGKEQPKKSTKQPTSLKHQKKSGKENVKAPPNHNRSQIKNNNPRPYGPAKVSSKKPPSHTRSQIKNDDRKPQGPAKISAQKPPNHNRSEIKHNDRQPAKVTHDKIRPHENNDRHHVKKHEPPHERTHSGHRDHPEGRSLHRHHSRHQHWPDDDNWHRHFRDWSWFISHRALNIGAWYADEHRERAVYIRFEPQDDDYFYLLESRYGHSTFRHRHHHRGYDGWCHYWFRGDNVIALFIRDDGFSQTYIWQRAEAESHSLTLGILTPDLQVVYSRYDADMPPYLAASYTQEVLWATVDDEP